MSNKYSTLITTVGASVIAECLLNGEKLTITQAAAGDGGGSYYQPTVDQTALRNEKWRGEIAAAGINISNPGMFDVKVVIHDADPFTVREVGLFDAAGNLIAICNTPDTEKASSADGASGKLTLLMHIVVADSSTVTFTINPSLNTVGQDEVAAMIGAHNSAADSHPGQFATFHSWENITVSAAAWLADDVNGGYYQTIAVDGVIETDKPDADVMLGADIAANDLYLDGWSCVTRIRAGDNSATLWANKKAPAVAFNIQLKVVR